VDKPLIVIPVRGGSQGIQNKALKPLGGIAPLARTIATVRDLGEVVIVTDDPAVIACAAADRIRAVPEPDAQAGQRTLDKAVFAAVRHASAPIVATVQCTSPLLRAETIQRCLDMVAQGSCDSALTVRDDRHVAWTGAPMTPTLATPWAIRQELPPRWVLTGGCVATRREFVTETRRFGGLIQLVEVAGAEAVDLDHPSDWALAEWYSGAPTTRELLMARILGEDPEWRGVVAQLSAWAESPEEWSYRSETGTVVGGRVIKIRGAHTAHEAKLAVEALKPGEADLTIVTSAYHQPRAFLTFLRVLERQRLDRTIRLWNAPAPSRMDKLAAEWEKIARYQASGDVASYDDGIAYLTWRDAMVPVAT
jgi:CMP-N-acetylneuraminic acid synthetase